MDDNECAVHDDGERGVKNVFGVVWAVVHTVNFQNNTSSRCRGATWSPWGLVPRLMLPSPQTSCRTWSLTNSRDNRELEMRSAPCGSVCGEAL